MSASIPIVPGVITTHLRGLVRPLAPAVPCSRSVEIIWASYTGLQAVIDFTALDELEFVFDVQAIHVNNIANTNILTLMVSDKGCNWQDVVAAGATAVRYPPPINPFRIVFKNAAATGTTLLTFYNYPQFPTHYP